MLQFVTFFGNICFYRMDWIRHISSSGSCRRDLCLRWRAGTESSLTWRSSQIAWRPLCLSLAKTASLWRSAVCPDLQVICAVDDLQDALKYAIWNVLECESRCLRLGEGVCMSYLVCLHICQRLFIWPVHTVVLCLSSHVSVSLATVLYSVWGKGSMCERKPILIWIPFICWLYSASMHFLTTDYFKWLKGGAGCFMSYFIFNFIYQISSSSMLLLL